MLGARAREGRVWIGVVGTALVLVALAGCSSAPLDGAAGAPSTTGRPAAVAEANGPDRTTGTGPPSCSRSAALFAATFADPSSLVAVAVTTKQVDELRAEVVGLRGELPADLRPDFDVQADAYLAAADALSRLSTSQGDDDLVVVDTAQAKAALAPLDEPKVQAARARMQAYFERCFEQLGR